MPICKCAQYNQDLALEYAKLAGAAYCDREQVKNWSCPQCVGNVTSVKMCTATSMDRTQAFVGRWRDGCVLSFEGTETLSSMLTDLDLYTLEPEPLLQDMCNGCSVHAGYLDVWTHLKPCIIQKLYEIGCSETAGSPLRVTGHSLGAGVSAIAMIMMERSGWNIRESYNFGMPRTGNAAFARNFTTTFAGKFWRLTHHKDPIVQLPPDIWGPISFEYLHVEPEVFYDGDVNKGYTICTDQDDKNCSEKYWDFDWDITFQDHLTYVDIPMGHGPCQTTVI